MSKIGIFGDPHLGIHGGNLEILNDQKNIFSQIKKFGKKHNIDYLVCLGDWFDSRYSTNNMILQESYKIVSDLATVAPFIILVGNHDLYFKNSREYYTPFIFESIPNVTVINNITKIDNMGFVPWLTENDSFELDADYLFGHFEFSGAKMNSTQYCKTGINISDVLKYKRVFSGHFHSPSVLKNVTYTGSIMAMTFAESDVVMGFYILDTETDTVEFIPFENQPIYMNISVSKESFKDIKNINISNNTRIKLRLLENIGQKNLNMLFKILKEKTNYPISYDILYQEEIKQKKEKLVSLDVRKYAKEYVSVNISETLKPMEADIINEIEHDLKEKGL